MPMPAHTTASRATWVTSSRALSDHVRGDQIRVSTPGGSVRGLEDIPCPPQGVDHRLAATVDLLAEVGHIELDDVGPSAEVVAPHPVQYLRLGKHALGVAHHEAQQLELGGGQRNRLSAARDFVAVLVKRKITDDDLGAARLARDAGPAQQ